MCFPYSIVEVAAYCKSAFGCVRALSALKNAVSRISPTAAERTFALTKVQHYGRAALGSQASSSRDGCRQQRELRTVSLDEYLVAVRP